MDAKTALMTPAQRLTKGLCPECGVSLEGVDPLAERDGHWSRRPKDERETAEALTRYNMLTNYATLHAPKE